jgi:hypothetical protein
LQLLSLFWLLEIWLFVCGDLWCYSCHTSIYLHKTGVTYVSFKSKRSMQVLRRLFLFILLHPPSTVAIPDSISFNRDLQRLQTIDASIHLPYFQEVIVSHNTVAVDESHTASKQAGVSTHLFLAGDGSVPRCCELAETSPTGSSRHMDMIISPLSAVKIACRAKQHEGR